MQLDDNDPTIPDRLVLRALIEDGLPSRAAGEDWPVRTPADFARLVFDSVLGAPYEQLLSEPVFANLPKSKLKAAAALAQKMIGVGGRATLDELIASSATLRANR